MTAVDTKHTFTVKVNAVDRTAYVREGTFRVQASLGQEFDTCNCTLIDKDGALVLPRLWQTLAVTDESAAVVFAGVITRIRKSVEVDDGTDMYECFAQDNGILLKTKIVRVAYSGMTDEAILDDLFSNYLSEVTTTNVTATSGTHEFMFDDVTLYDAVQTIAGRTGQRWYVDYAKDLHYWSGLGTAAAYDLVENATADYSTTYPWEGGTLFVEDDGEAIVNRVIVRGGVSESAVLTQAFSGNGSTAEFFVTYAPIRSIVSITVGGVYQTWGTDFSIDDFLDADANTVNCLIVYGFGRIRWDASNAPAAGSSNIVVKYTCDDVVHVTRNNLASQAATAYNRIIEKVIVDRNIHTVAQAEAVADEELRQAALAVRRVRVVSRRYGLKPGDIVGITCTPLHMDRARGYGSGGYGEDGYGGDKYVVQSVTTSIEVGWVRHELELACYQPALGIMMRGITYGTVSDGGM